MHLGRRPSAPSGPGLTAREAQGGAEPGAALDELAALLEGPGAASEPTALEAAMAAEELHEDAADPDWFPEGQLGEAEPCDLAEAGWWQEDPGLPQDAAAAQLMIEQRYDFIVQALALPAILVGVGPGMPDMIASEVIVAEPQPGVLIVEAGPAPRVAEAPPPPGLCGGMVLVLFMAAFAVLTMACCRACCSRRRCRPGPRCPFAHRGRLHLHRAGGYAPVPTHAEQDCDVVVATSHVEPQTEYVNLAYVPPPSQAALEHAAAAKAAAL